MATFSEQTRQPESIDRRRLIFSTTSSLLILVACLFLPAGTWAWSRGWLFLGFVLGASVVSTIYLRRVNPDVIAGRVNRHERPLRWDLLLGLIGFLPTMLAIPIVAALDDGRYHWSHVPWWACLLGYALIITGFVGVTWATSVNKFFEPIVRIQTDRGHKVIDTGPYAIVRHPGYVFGYLLFLGMPQVTFPTDSGAAGEPISVGSRTLKGCGNRALSGDVGDCRRSRCNRTATGALPHDRRSSHGGSTRASGC